MIDRATNVPRGSPKIWQTFASLTTAAGANGINFVSRKEPADRMPHNGPYMKPTDFLPRVQIQDGIEIASVSPIFSLSELKCFHIETLWFSAEHRVIVTGDLSFIRRSCWRYKLLHRAIRPFAVSCSFPHLQPAAA